MSTIGVTGHRPDKLYGYKNYPYSLLRDPRYIQMRKDVEEILLREECKKVWTGMSIGFDIVVALAVLELQDMGYNIELHCAIPCQNHTSKWDNPAIIKMYNNILKKATSAVLVTDAPYAVYLMQVRNVFMVDESDKILAMWDGSKGGTCNCIEYAKKKNKEIIYMKPINGKEV